MSMTSRQRQAANATQALIQVFAFEQLHDDKRRAVFVFVKVIDLHDVRMTAPTPSWLHLKALVDLGSSRFAMQALTAKPSAGPNMTRCVDCAHAATTEHSALRDRCGSAVRPSSAPVGLPRIHGCLLHTPGLAWDPSVSLYKHWPA